MIFISEAASMAALDHRIAFDAVERAFVTAAGTQRANFAVVLGHGADPRNRFTIKSACRLDEGGLSGAKIGTYWPDNATRGLPNHNSCVLLLDELNGRIGAVIEGGGINGLRTAAADAVAAVRLARPDTRVLAIFGAGNQARFEVDAIRRVLPIDTVLVVNRNRDRALAYVAELTANGVAASVAEAEDACRRADMIVTVTGSRAPLFEAEWVRPGTHVASMGSDAVGKQELPSALMRRARLYCDLPSQSVVIGEFQHVAAEIERGEIELFAIGTLITGNAPGRQSPEDITIFDSSGIALQDLFIGKAVLDAIKAREAEVCA